MKESNDFYDVNKLSIGLLFLFFLVLDIYFSTFSIMIDKLINFISEKTNNLEYIFSFLKDYYFIVSFLIFIILFLFSFNLLKKICKTNNCINKKFAKIILYKDVNRVNLIVNEEGHSKLKTPLVIISNITSIILFIIPVYTNITNLLNSKFVDSLKVYLLMILIVSVIKHLILMLLDSIELKSCNRNYPEILADLNANSYSKLIYLSIQAENHFCLYKTSENDFNKWLLINEEKMILKNERITIYSFHKCNNFFTEKIYSTTLGYQAIVDFKLNINFREMIIQFNKSKFAIDNYEKGKFDLIILDFKKFISEIDININEIISKNANNIKIEAINLLSSDNFDSNPDNFSTSYEKFKSNMKTLNSLTLKLTETITSDVQDNLNKKIKEQLPIIYNFLYLKVLIKKIDITEEIQRKINQKLDFFNNLFTKIIESKIKIDNVNIENKSIKKDIIQNNSLSKNDNLIEVIFQSIIKAKHQISDNKQYGKDDFFNYALNEIKSDQLSKSVLYTMKDSIFESFISKLNQWEKEDNEETIHQEIVNFVTIHFLCLEKK